MRFGSGGGGSGGDDARARLLVEGGEVAADALYGGDEGCSGGDVDYFGEGGVTGR